MTVQAYRMPFLEDYDVRTCAIRHKDGPLRWLNPLLWLDDLGAAVEAHNATYGPEAPVPPRLLMAAEKFGARLERRPQARYHRGPGGILHDALMEVAAEIQPGTTELDEG
jgi:hypothetical protein